MAQLVTTFLRQPKSSWFNTNPQLLVVINGSIPSEYDAAMKKCPIFFQAGIKSCFF